MDINDLNLALAKMQFGVKRRAMMYEKIKSFATQGTPVYNTIEMFAEAYHQRRGDARALILDKWLESMRDGQSFSRSITGFAPEAEIMLIAAGESNGDLSGGMSKAIFVTESTSKIRGALVGGLSYSALLMIVLFAMIYMFSIKVIPEMVAILPVDTWPPISQKLYFMSEFVKNYGFLVIGGFILFLIVSIKTLGIFVGPVRMVLDYVPPWNIYKTVQGSVFLITLSAMMTAGITLNNSLHKIKELSSPYIAGYIDEMLALLSDGRSNGEILTVGLLNKDVELDITLLGKTADFQSSMMMLGENSIEETINRIKSITGAIGTASLFLIAGFVIFVYLGFFTLTSSISDSAAG